MLLRGKYASAKLFQANRAYRAQKPMEVTVQAGDLVGVIQQKDPMGDGNRWYVDVGLMQGFLPCSALSTIGEDQAEESNSNPNNNRTNTWDRRKYCSNDREVASDLNKIDSTTYENESSISKVQEDRNNTESAMTQSKHEHQYRSSESFDVQISHETSNDAIENSDKNTEVITTEAVVHAYDDVAPDESHPDDNTKEIKAHPVRKAPDPPTAGKSMKNEPPEEHSEQLEEADTVQNGEKVKTVSERDENNAESGKDISHEQQGDQEEIYGTNEIMDDELEKGSAITVNSNSSCNSNSNDYSTNAQVGHDTDIERTGSHHSYEEIPPSEANSEVSVNILNKIKNIIVFQSSKYLLTCFSTLFSLPKT